jgi:aminopeptidase N
VTKPLSTYLYAILSGPYTEIPSPAQYIHNNIPMSIFCRASLLKYVQKDADEIFSLTSNGMKVYEELFGYPYPFGKYDQIFCPEYSTGAMENAGAVTLNDRYVFQEEVPKSERADR